MKNLFEQSRSHWVRYDRYELKAAADGKRYITPGKNAEPDIYNPLKEAPGIVMSLVGSHFGTKLQLMVPEKYLQYLLLLVLPVVAFVVLRQRQLPEERGQIEPKAQMAIVCVSTFFIGAYDGFYGPGSGTFFLLVFCNLAKMDVRTASGNVKLVNLASNIGALITSLMSGKVFIVLGLIGTVTSFAGHFLGAGLAIKNGSKIVKPTVIVVLILLAVKVVQGLSTGSN